MSCTEVKAVWPGEKNEDFEELSNSHGSAPPIWEKMCEKYLGTVGHSCMFDGTIDKLWPLWRDDNIPEYQRAVLMITYDFSYVSKKYYQRAAEDIGKFLDEFYFNPDHVNHWPRIKEIFESDPDVPAIGLHCTSVTENPYDGPWNEEKEYYEQPDWSKYYCVYEELDKLELRKVPSYS